MHTATTSPKRAPSARTTGRGTLLLLQGTLYQLEGALPVRNNEPADDEADANASKSLDELETLNGLRNMMEEDSDSEELVDPPLRDTTPAFITPPPREHTRRSLAEQRRQRAAAPTADNDQVDPDESHDPEDPSSDRAQQNESGDYDEPSVPRPRLTQHGAPQLAHTQLPATPSVPSMLSSSIPTASSLPVYSVNSDGNITLPGLQVSTDSPSDSDLHPFGGIVSSTEDAHIFQRKESTISSTELILRALEKKGIATSSSPASPYIKQYTSQQQLLDSAQPDAQSPPAKRTRLTQLQADARPAAAAASAPGKSLKAAISTPTLEAPMPFSATSKISTKTLDATTGALINSLDVGQPSAQIVAAVKAERIKKEQQLALTLSPFNPEMYDKHVAPTSASSAVPAR